MGFKTVNVDEDELREAIDSNLGWCYNCNDFTNSGVEPDAENYECECCGNPSVMGAENALIEGYIGIGGGVDNGNFWKDPVGDRDLGAYLLSLLG